MKRFQILSFLILSLFSFQLFGQKNITGNYICIETKSQLVLKSDNSFRLINSNSGMLIFHIDTLSFGIWKKEGEFIILNTPKSIESRRLKIFVEEKFIPNSDSLILEIHNPYEEDVTFKYKNFRIFEYVFNIDSYDARFGPEIFMKGNRISLLKSSTDKIVNLNLTIVPNSYLYPSTLAFNYLVTDMYTFKDRNSNYLKIFIPDFTFDYIGYERFKNEYARISKNKIILRGNVYEKQPANNRFK